MGLRLVQLIAALLAMMIALSVSSGAQEGAFSSKAPRAILIDAESGAVLYQQRADELAPPASMSKLMTLAMLFKALKSGQMKLSDEIEMSVNAWRTGGAPSRTSSMFVPVNGKATIEELIQGITVQSGNDACIAIAEAMTGSEAQFAKAMTAEARRIGLDKATFANATGLHDPNHLMTTRELAMLARYLIETYPEYYRFFGQKEFQYRKHKFINRNPLLTLDLGADGMKTGYIRAAGYGLVGSAVQDGKRLIVVVGGLETAAARKSEAARLLDWGFKSFSTVKIFDEGEIIGRARVWGGAQWYVPLEGKGDVMITLPKYPANQRLSAEIVYLAPLKPPVKKGEQVATLKVSSTSSASAEVPLYASEDVEKAGIIGRGLDTLVLMALRRLAL